jgi:hypothetical protein
LLHSNEQLSLLQKASVLYLLLFLQEFLALVWSHPCKFFLTILGHVASSLVSAFPLLVLPPDFDVFFEVVFFFLDFL